MDNTESQKPLAQSENRIRAACVQLELALANFEDDSEANARILVEREKLKRLRDQLEDIRKQIRELSS